MPGLGSAAPSAVEEEEARFRENWGLSQFWYEDATADAVAGEVIRVSASAQLAVACVACPTLFRRIRRRLLSASLNVSETLSSRGDFPCPETLHLLEYDRRFAAFGTAFTFYDYRDPANVPAELHHRFDVVVADPPYLSQECLEKTAETVRLLAKDPSVISSTSDSPKILLLTGSVQEDLAKELLGLRPCKFKPQHKSKLGNEFRIFTSYEPESPIGGWDEEPGK